MRHSQLRACRLLDAALNLARDAAAKSSAAEIMIIGGAQVYAQALPLAGRVYLTRIAVHLEGDTLFPDLDPRVWRQIAANELPRASTTEPTATAYIYERLPE